MEASVRIFNSSNRHFSNSVLILRRHPLKFPHHSSFPYPPRPPPLSIHPYCRYYTIRSNPYCSTRIHSSFPISTPLGFLRFLPASLPSHSSISTDQTPTRTVSSSSKGEPFEWNFASDGVNGSDLGIGGEKRPLVTVVLLGWLGGKPKHLRRYAEFYNSRGIHAVTFVASVKDVLWFDLGSRLQERISALARELASWLSEVEKDGRERFLLFHTFSNTGWLAYGAILDNLHGRQDLLEKIKGCVVDSGGDPDINPKVWAAGFAAALLKKHSSSAYSSVEAGGESAFQSGVTVSKLQEKEPPLIEVFLLMVFEKLFSFLLNLPDVNERLAKVIFALSKNQPPCPQLYLYSTADKVIPFHSVESFIENQRRMGRKVWSFNFGSSPHVDHYRTFPDIYSSQLQNFLKKCLSMVKQM